MAVALIVAAGRGERLGSELPKALVEVAGRPMLAWSLETLQSLEAVREIVVALPAHALADAAVQFPTIRCVAGGAFRSQSVRLALRAVRQPGPVVVHDAARPLAPAALFTCALEELERHGADAVVAAAPLSDTVKEVGQDGHLVTHTLDRSRLWAAQTPQVFRRALLESVLEHASDELLASATDDAWLVERAGGVVRVVPTREPNFKITTAADLSLAELFLTGRAA